MWQCVQPEIKEVKILGFFSWKILEKSCGNKIQDIEKTCLQNDVKYQNSCRSPKEKCTIFPGITYINLDNEPIIFISSDRIMHYKQWGQELDFILFDNWQWKTKLIWQASQIVKIDSWNVFHSVWKR